MSPDDAAGLAWVLGAGGGLASIALSGWLVHVIVDGYRRRQQLRAATELQLRVLDRVGSAREFGEFLATDAGSRFLEAIRPDRHVAQTGILRTLQSGIVALVVGPALIAVGTRLLGSAGAAALGMMCAALGAGLLLAAAVSHRTARRMGLFQSARLDADDRQRS